MTNDSFYRIGRLPPYVFAEVTAMKAKSRAEGCDVIDFGMGNPDSKPPAHVIAKLKEIVSDPKASRYSLSRGIYGLRKAQAAYYARRFGVELHPDREICVTIGSKEGLATLAQAISQPGDHFIVPDPSYPIHTWGFVIPGGEVIPIPNAPGDALAALPRAIEGASKKPVALVLNYPCNPTAATATLDFYAEAVKICKHYGIYLISDLAYCEIYFDGNPPPSVLQVPGAKDIAVEFTTMSKSYSMAGWRIGFACGNPALVAALTKLKSYLDYGTFLPVQVAAATALTGPQDYVEKMRTLYKERRDIMVAGLNDAGWPVSAPNASMFLWAEIPPQLKHLGSLEFSKQLLTEADVAVAPGIGFGPGGEGFVRIALVENKHRIRQAIKNMKRFLGGQKLEKRA